MADHRLPKHIKTALLKGIEFSLTKAEICRTCGISLRVIGYWFRKRDESPELQEIFKQIAAIKEDREELWWTYVGHKIIDLMSEGNGPSEVAAWFHIGHTTWRNWIKREEIAGLYEVAKMAYESFWLTAGREGMKTRSFNTGAWCFNVKNRCRSFGSGEKWSDHVEFDIEKEGNLSEILSLRATQKRMMDIKLMELANSGAITINDPEKLKAIEDKSDETTSDTGKESNRE